MVEDEVKGYGHCGLVEGSRRRDGELDKLGYVLEGFWHLYLGIKERKNLDMATKFSSSSSGGCDGAICGNNEDLGKKDCEECKLSKYLDMYVEILVTSGLEI